MLLSELTDRLMLDVPAEDGVPSEAQYQNAVKDAIAAAGNGKTAVQLDAPATPERILSSIAKVRA